VCPKLLTKIVSILFTAMVSSFSRAAFLTMCAFNSIRSIGYLVDAIGIVFGHSMLVIGAFHSPGTKSASVCASLIPDISGLGDVSS